MSDAAVVAASRAWICVRLATYENKAEGDFLASIFTGRSGQLENTVFTFMAPDGTSRLTRAGRGPHHVLGGPGSRRGPPPARRGPPPPGAHDEAKDMAALMHRLVGKYKSTKKIEALPQALDFRRALNVAACDNQPLVVAYAKSATTRGALQKLLADLAWREAFVGRLQYIVVEDRKVLAKLKEVPAAEGIYFVQPNRFGIEGEVVGATKSDAKVEAVATMLRTSLATFKTVTKDTRDQRRQARRAGIETWKTEIPVTDPGIPPGGQRGSRPPR